MAADHFLLDRNCSQSIGSPYLFSAEQLSSEKQDSRCASIGNQGSLFRASIRHRMTSEGLALDWSEAGCIVDMHGVALIASLVRDRFALTRSPDICPRVPLLESKRLCGVVQMNRST